MLGVRAPSRERLTAPQVMLGHGESSVGGEAQQGSGGRQAQVQVLALLWLVCACVESLRFSDCSYFICKMEIILIILAYRWARGPALAICFR